MTKADEIKRLREQNAELLAELKRLVASIENWNEAVQKIIGRVPDSGMFLDSARAVIAKVEGKG